MMHLSKTFCIRQTAPQSSERSDCEKPFAEGVATAGASAKSAEFITAKGDVL